ncbi:Intracellular exo-alpha-(1-_5)-L-arabinofuranosidase [Tessaracoccus sp. O5.2]|uniref:arabinosylfuranosidase ArfA n=1 Tax=Tessaracoccus sp. O5.2 TaxID=3157622 RepID=UPI0035F0481E
MAESQITIHPSYRVGPLNRRLFGTFVEHMGRCVYTGIYEPGHATADAHGFRGDVAELVRELGATIVRYPGGNFVSNYKWEDGVGPKEQRPRRLDLAWRSIETNQVGTDDFLAWCERQGIEPMLAVNLGTRGLEDAVEYLDYVNGSGTTLADQRAANGREEPWGVKVWCLGNEMDGPWQMGHMTAAEYGRVAEEVGNAFRRFDDSLELVACGSSNRLMPTFGAWEREVLERSIHVVDHISAHAYYEPIGGDTTSYLACAEDMDRFITSVAATADAVAAARKVDKLVTISFDEWNVWFQERFDGENAIQVQEAPPLIQDVYDVADAVVVGSLLITLMRHTDRVAMACQAQLVNIIAPIRTEPDGPAWRQTIFHPFALTSRYARGDVLDLRIASPTIDTAAFGPVDQIWGTATLDDANGDLAIFCVNRSERDDLTTSVDLAPLGNVEIVEHLMVHEDDPSLTNVAGDERVGPKPGRSALDGSTLTLTLPAVSWHCIRLSVRPA